MRKVIQLSLVLLLMVSMANAQRENAINIISYNIRLNVASDGENAWPKRKDNVKALVRFHDADILCVQEALPLQVDELLENTN